MKILAVDTAAKSLSVAVVDSDSLLAEVTLITGQTHSKHLLDSINKVIGLSGLDVSELNGFAVTVGPGTFTGLRIGISSVKGLALASGKPVVGISSLDVLAMQSSGSPYLICTMIDARRGEVYFCTYRFINGVITRETNEKVLSPSEAVGDIREPCLFVGNGAFLYAKTIINGVGKIAHFAAPCQNTVYASTVACLGMERLKKNDTDDLSSLKPHYIRKSDALLKSNQINFGRLA